MLVPLRSRTPHMVLPIAALCMLIVLVGCSSSGGPAPTSPSPSAPSSTSVSEERIVIKDFRFEPVDLAVAPGARVSVVNEDSAPHTVTAKAADAFDTGTVKGGETATFTAPPAAGTYRYVCSIHPSMTGTLTVR